MNLDQYRLIIRRRMNAFRAGWLFYLLLVAAMNIAGERITDHPAFSGLMGFLAGGLLVGIFSMSKFHRALKDDVALRRLYNTEHDERMQAIRAKAGVPVVLILNVAMIGAGLIATFFNMTVALTLVSAAVVQMLVSLAIKFWCMRTM